MSRIYNNQPLRNLPVVNIEYNGAWDVRKFTSGKGVILEGSIQNRSHFVINDHSRKKFHYYIFYVKIYRAHKRKFDSSNVEIEPNFSETKMVSTGYLNSSYKLEAKGQTDYLSKDETLLFFNKHSLAEYTQKYGTPDQAAIWLDEEHLAGIEFDSGDDIRVKTCGDGPLVFSIAKLDTKSAMVSNYAGGEKVGSSWTDKIMDIKSSMPVVKDNEGAADNEWDD